jgi:nucleotide-binding universal stress UspA family protein
MWLTKKILIPSDFGAASRQACDVGLELAQQFHVPLVLMHVFAVPAAVYRGVPLAPATEYAHLMEQSAQAALEEEAARLRGKTVEVETALRTGTAWEEILETAKKLDVGLIVMGTHGRRGIPRALLGSVAEKVVRLAPVPVLTIHSAASEEPST